MADFDDARRAALLSDIRRFLQGLPRDLLPFGSVREKLRLRHTIDRGIREVPIDRIVGSIGREREFNRMFLPRDESLRARWEDIRDSAEGSGGFPTVELYEVGNAYFVVDGHHRVSVTRAMNAPSIEAHVREFVSEVPIRSDDSIEELVLRRGRLDFLEASGLEAEEGEFHLTQTDGYERMLDHVDVHRYYLGLEQKRDIGAGEAARSWRSNVYEPVIRIIRESRVLEEFSGRTETDLYLFAMDHLHYLRERHGDEFPPARAVEEIKASTTWSERARGFLRRIVQRFSA
ncbi:MAG: hypothetical protein JJE51_06340 [Thermoanaerobaculia bacterium]|nr:hypothetical protein [Thermoanaerobaculia bacterium]